MSSPAWPPEQVPVPASGFSRFSTFAAVVFACIGGNAGLLWSARFPWKQP
jgi:hypothetical protein